MQHVDPYQVFTPIHVAWLYRRDDKKLDVTAADLASISAAFPEAKNDELFNKYAAKAAEGALRRRPGRKPLTPLRFLRLWAAKFEIEDETQQIWKLRREGLRPRRPFEKAPVVQAAEIVARKFRFGSGASLLNLLSRHRIS
jgi:hypothetical protein